MGLLNTQGLGKKIGVWLGTFGALTAVTTGGFQIYDRLHSHAVHIVIRKSPLDLYGTLVDPEDPLFRQLRQRKIGTVTIEITNASPDALHTPKLELQNLNDFHGMAVVEGSIRDRASNLQRGWMQKRGQDDPTLDLPDFGVNDTLIVQAFGSNWESVDANLTGTLAIRREWLITIPDSVTYQLLFRHHVWWICLFVLPAICVLLILSLFERKAEEKRGAPPMVAVPAVPGTDLR